MQNLINSVKDLILEAGKLALASKQRNLSIEYKSDASPVTNADIEIDKFICSTLKVLTPDYGIISEEGERYNIYSYNFWSIDPIDGTRSYVKNQDTYTINIGLIENGRAKLGFIYQPEKGRLYFTNTSGKLQVEEYGKIVELKSPLKNDPLIAVTGSHSLDVEINQAIKNVRIKHVKRIPSSLKLCYIAEGSADFYPNLSPKMQWDIAAGHALITAAGGEILDMNQKEFTYNPLNLEFDRFFAYSTRLRQAGF